MKVFVAILALAAAASAAEIPLQREVVAEPAVMHPEAIVPVSEHRAALDEMRIFSIFSAPSHARDAYLRQEKHGLQSLFEKPVVLVFKNVERNMLEPVLLKDGLMSLYTKPEFAGMRSAMLSGPAKIGMMLSAVRYLELPELNMPVADLKMPRDTTLASVFRMDAMEAEKAPWVYVAVKDNLRAFDVDKLVELGSLSMHVDKLSILRDFSPAITREILVTPESGLTGLTGLTNLNALAALRNGAYIQETESPVDFERLAALEGYRSVPVNVRSGLQGLQGLQGYRNVPVTSYQPSASPYFTRSSSVPSRIVSSPLETLESDGYSMRYPARAGIHYVDIN